MTMTDSSLGLDTLSRPIQYLSIPPHVAFSEIRAIRDAALHI
jgi:hypothetical protein